MSRLITTLRRLRRTLLARRRLLAAVATAVAVAAGLQAATAPPAPTRAVLTAARDLPAGAVLTRGDLTRAAFTPRSVPTGVLTSARAAVGRTIAAPLRAGEPITDVRLVTGTLLDGYPGLVAAPVRIGDPGAVGLLRVGDRVDVVAADPRGEEEAQLVASDAVVVALPREPDRISATASGGLVLLAVSEHAARDLASAGVARYLSLVLRH
jgi:Flp pilus assembly protein CpaB